MLLYRANNNIDNITKVEGRRAANPSIIFMNSHSRIQWDESPFGSTPSHNTKSSKENCAARQACFIFIERALNFSPSARARQIGGAKQSGQGMNARSVDIKNTAKSWRGGAQISMLRKSEDRNPEASEPL